MSKLIHTCPTTRKMIDQLRHAENCATCRLFMGRLLMQALARLVGWDGMPEPKRRKSK